MVLSMRSCEALTGALLVLAVAAAGDAARAGQDGTGALTAHREYTSAKAEHRRYARAEQRRRMEQQAWAHAQMPSTMHASTPDPALPPHPAHSGTLDASAERAPLRPVAGVSASSAVGQVHRIVFFPAASRWERFGYQGFARIINRTGEAGEVRIEAWDDAGVRHGPATLSVNANESVQFNSADLESGNAGLGLSGGIGAGTGDWRLGLSSRLDLQVLSYIRTREGFLTSMHDRVPQSEGAHRVLIFNPGRNRSLVSRLRLVNRGTRRAEVRIEGIDATGATSEGAVAFTLAAGASRMLSAQQLESGEGAGLSGALGTGQGKWQLVVSAEQPIEVMNLLSTRSGHLTNLSTAPEHTESVGGGATVTHSVAFFPSAARWAQGGYQGFARIINRTGEAGEVRIEAWDDAGVRHGPATLSVSANESVQFNSADLESGNAGLGLSGGIGAGTGDWRLGLSSRLDLQVLSYIRTREGFLTSMHDLVPGSEGAHRVLIFNPGRNRSLVSRLRLVNSGTRRARVRIEGIDATGATSEDAVTLRLAAGASRMLSAQQLESGEGAGLSGALGTGRGKWQLVVSAGQPIEVMNLLSTRSGHLANLSTAPGTTTDTGPEDAEAVFREHISGPIVQAKCVACHVEGGLSGNTRLVFVRSTNPDHEALNLRAFEDFLGEVDEGADVVLNKIQGVAHGGGVQVAAGTPEFTHMERFLRLLGEDVSAVPLTPQALFGTVKMAPWRKTPRRTALIVAALSAERVVAVGALEPVVAGAADGRAAAAGAQEGKHQAHPTRRSRNQARGFCPPLSRGAESTSHEPFFVILHKTSLQRD